MAQLRLKTAIEILLSEDAAQKQKLIDLLDDGALIIDDYTATAQQQCIQQVKLLAGAVDQAVGFGSVTRASTMLLYCRDGDFAVKLDAAPAALPVRGIPADTTGSPVSAAAQSRQPAVVFWRGRINSISLSNPGSSTVNVIVALVGDAAA